MALQLLILTGYPALNSGFTLAISSKSRRFKQVLKWYV